MATLFSEDLLAATVSASPKNKKGEASWKDKLKFPVGPFRDFCRAASNSLSASAEFAAAWAGETAPNVEDEKEVALRTRFDFTAGPQAFVGMLRELKEGCTAPDLQRSLFTGWRYSTAAVSMRWTRRMRNGSTLFSPRPNEIEQPADSRSGGELLGR
jgi:hypothetical protein